MVTLLVKGRLHVCASSTRLSERTVPCCLRVLPFRYSTLLNPVLTPGQIGAYKGFLRTQGRTCHWCGRQLRQGQITLDRITPRSKVGTDHPSNLVPSCAAYNCHKDSYDLSAWLSRLEHIVNRLRESLSVEC